jgi:hypothetical protein
MVVPTLAHDKLIGEASSRVGCQSGAVVRSMFEINISACHL